MSSISLHPPPNRLGSSGAVAATWLGVSIASVAAGYVATTEIGLFRLELAPTWPNLALLATLLAACGVLMRRPGCAVVFLVGIVFLDLSHVLVRSHGFPSVLHYAAVPLGLAAWLHRGPRSAPPAWSHPLTLALALYTAVLLLSTVFARDRALADARLLEVLKALILYGLVVALTIDPRRLRFAVWSVVGAGGFLAALGMVQVLTGAYHQSFGGLARVKHAHIHGGAFEPRLAGPLGDPNFFAQMLLVALPLTLYLGDARKTSRRLPIYALAGLIAAAIVFTYSRGGALALLVVLLPWVLARRFAWRGLLFAGALACLAAFLLPSDFVRRLTTIHEFVPGQQEQLHPDSSFAKRRLLALGAWRIFLDHPILGVGTGNYTVHFESYADEVDFTSSEYDDPDLAHYAHNLYLEILSETGAVGLGAFGLVVGYALAHAAKARRRYLDAGDAASAGLSRAVQVSLVGYLVSSLFLHGHYLRYLWLLLALVTALSVLSSGIDTSRRQEARS